MMAQPVEALLNEKLESEIESLTDCQPDWPADDGEPHPTTSSTAAARMARASLT